MNPLLLSLALLAPCPARPEGERHRRAARRRRRQAAQSRLRDRHAQGLDRRRATPSRASRSRATPSIRRRDDMQSRHQGQFWIGGFEKLGDKPTGTLTSVPFKVTHPWASFLVGGGPHATETCVETRQRTRT